MGESTSPTRVEPQRWKGSRLRRAVAVVALLNAAYFLVEFVAAARIGSASLFADSADFLEDTAINLLVFVGAAMGAAKRRVAGRVLAFLILIPAIAAVATVVLRVLDPQAPSGEGMTLTAVGALCVNVVCAVILLRVRNTGTSLARGAWLAARNDALANLLIMAAGAATLAWPTAWFDIAVGLVIALMNLSAFKEVLEAAGDEAD